MITAPGKLASTVRTIRTRARAAMISRPDDGITVVTSQAPFTVVACGVVLTAQTLPCHCVTVFSMAVTLAGLAAGKAPVPGETSVTLPSIYALETVALARDSIAESVHGSL